MRAGKKVPCRALFYGSRCAVNFLVLRVLSSGHVVRAARKSFASRFNRLENLLGDEPIAFVVLEMCF